MRALQQETSSDLVQFAGYLSEGQLAALLDACAALMFPSLYEGFGLPVLEAMALGKPILCSNLPSLKEVAGDCAIYFDPSNSSQIAEAIDHIPDPARLTEREQCGRQRARQFGTAEAMANRYLDVLNSC
jgi:glycosyltransferase involved in cell wall biosynthesis